VEDSARGQSADFLLRPAVRLRTGLRARVRVGLAAAVETFEPRGLPLALTRSLLALASLVTLVFSPDRALFVGGPAAPEGMRCGGPARLSLWCLSGASSHGLLVSRLAAEAVLLAALTGFRPRWTCVPHWYVSASLAWSMTEPNGGDSAAMMVTLLLIPALVRDDRRWHWTRPRTPLPPAWRGSAYAAWLALRCQVALIYLQAALTKAAVPEWRHGEAMATVFSDPEYGFPRFVRNHFGAVLANGFVIHAATWGTLAVELAIAGCVLAGRRGRRAGVLLAVPLHCAIGLGMGLVSFGTVMVAMNLSGLFPTRAAAAGASAPTESSTCYPDDIPVAA
jgi:antimicrobial peptide system SdpB family protein